MKEIELPKLLEPEILKRFRRYLIYYSLCFLGVWIILFIYSSDIVSFLTSYYLKFFKESSLVFTSIEEVFFVLLKVSFYSTLIMTLPFFIIPLAKFVFQNLEEKNNFFKKFLLFSIFSLISGFLIGYFLILPGLLRFFLFFGQRFAPLLKIDFFILFLLKVLLFSVLIFQFPLCLILLIKINLLKKDLYQKKKIYFWGFFYGLALLISPTDFFVQVLLTLTFYLFFKLSFWLSKFF